MTQDTAANPHPAARAVTALTILALLSPLAGLALEMTLAWRFGTSAIVDAFRISALLILLGQQLSSIEVLPNLVVPVFSEYRVQGKEREAWRLAFSLANLLLIPATVIAVLIFLWPDPVVHFLGPGLNDKARGLAVFFVRWSALTFIPLIWGGVAAGVLYAQRIFWLPTASQLFSNVIFIIIILLLSRRLGSASVVVGILLASIGSWILHMVRLAVLMGRTGIRTFWGVPLSHPGLRQVLHLALPLLGGIVVSQWNAIVVHRELSQLSAGTLATFGYALKMNQLVTLLPTALATVLFPRLTESWYASAEKEFPDLCTRALRMALFVAFPLTCISFLLRTPLIALLFQRGAFSAEVGETAAQVFGLLLLAAPAFVLYVSLQKMLYAVQEMWMLTYIQLAGALLLTGVAPALAAHFGVDGVVWSLVILAWLLDGVSLLVLSWKYKAIHIKESGVFALKILLLAIAGAWLGSECGKILGRLIESSVWSLGLTIVSSTLLAGFIFYGAALLLRFPEAIQSRQYLHWQGNVLMRKMQFVGNAFRSLTVV